MMLIKFMEEWGKISDRHLVRKIAILAIAECTSWGSVAVSISSVSY